MIAAVCFDLDGTLFDDRQYVEAGLRAAARALADAVEGDAATEAAQIDAERFEAALFEAYFERGVRERTFDHVLDCWGLSADLVPTLVEAYHDHEEALDPYPEAARVLDRLRADYRLGLLTGGTNGHAKLDRLDLRSAFDAVVVAPARDLTKRDPEPFELLLDELDVQASEAAYVGDRPELDFPHPNDLGMTTVQVETGFHSDVAPETERERPDVTVESLAALPDVLEAME